MKKFFPVVFFLFSANCFVLAQSSVIVRNSTWQEFEVSVLQYGTHTMETTEWTQLDTIAKAWKEGDSEIFQTNRDEASIPLNDTVYFDIKLSGQTDTLVLKLRIAGITGGSDLAYSISGNSFSEPWQNDGNFHELQTTLAGKNVIIKYKPDNDDSGFSRDIRFAIHDLPVYEIDPVDFQNPDVLNIMAYNIQMLPFGVSGLPEAAMRADFLPAQISEWQDVVSFAEAFDDSPREDHLEPAMLAAGFPYKTTILNDPGGGLIPTNGGVIIFSRWPIETEAQIDFELCGPNAQDCLSNKGIKYARINKMGKKYHIFGTHMDAGSGQEDYDAKLSQIGEMRQFIDDLAIPSAEAVVFGGDFNIAPIDDDSLYFNFLDTLNPVIPYPIGDDDSNFSDRHGNIIDHVWGDSRHLLPLEATNKVITVRSLENDMWELSEFSDHRCVIARFVYPDVSANAGDTVLCPHDSLLLQVSADNSIDLQWKKDGNDIAGETGISYALENVAEADGGFYQCALGYDVTFGNDPGNDVLQFFYPNGAVTFNSQSTFDFDIVVDSVLCALSIDEYETQALTIYPNPSPGAFFINNPSAEKGVLEIYSATGALVYSSTLLPGINKVELGQSPGIYLTVLRAGEKLFTGKLLIQ